MQVQQNVIKDMLKNIEDPKLREVYGSIISGQIVKQVRCMSDDIFEKQEVRVTDDEGRTILYQRGEKKGQPKTEIKNVLTRKGCKGRVIAYIDEAGKVDETEPVLSPPEAMSLYESGLEGSRLRLDGQVGFRCYCGNNSILCEEEKGVITPARPSQADLEKIASRLTKRNGNMYEPKNGKTEIDGFVIEEVKV